MFHLLTTIYFKYYNISQNNILEVKKRKYYLLVRILSISGSKNKIEYITIKK